MEYHSISGEEALRQLHVDPAHGLREEEARQLLAREGRNRLEQKRGDPWWKRLLAQFKDFMVLALLAAAGISAAAALLGGGGDYLDSIIIVAIVLINGIVGMIQEGRAEKALDALEKLSAPTAEVLRGGQRKRIPADEVVRGDVLFLETGDLVPADARLLEASALSTQESALTGESMPSKKEAGAILPAAAAPADRRNMVLSSTVVLSGHGKALVTATGMQTQVGRIAGLLSQEKAPQTPLQQRLEKVGKQLGIGAMAISALVFLLGFLQKLPLLDSFLLSVSLAVAAIPEGLPAMVTVVLSLGVQRMAKSNAIVRRLPAVETLGCASVICSDKTGTLTQNKMTITHLATAQGELALTEAAARRLLRLAALCCNATVQGSGKRKTLIGEPTETAIVDAAVQRRLPAMQDREQYPRLGELPFDSARKRMSVLCRFPEGKSDAPASGKLLITKGAPDILMARCRSAEVNGRVVPLDAALRSKLLAQNDAMAARALRVIAVAVKPLPKEGNTRELAENELTFLGLIGMHDPLRREAKAAVKTCKRAGITPIMITGDHIATAVAIAEELGIIETARGAGSAMTGSQLDTLSDERLPEALKTCRVFARVTPEHKMRIVKALREQGHVVAMTGDGVNDAPALKAADIGCAMGRSGTEVAKGAADMILTDDNFATIVRAVELGRGIYDNIKKAVHFLISSNIGEIVAVFFASLFGMPPPLLPIQLLWVNVVTDSAPAIALGMEPTDKHIMNRPPKPVNQSFFSGSLGFHMALEGLFMGAVTLLAFVLGRSVLGMGDDLALGRTMAFSVLSFVEIAHANNMRSERSLLVIGPFSNSRMNFANFLCIGLQAVVVSFPPLCAIFGTVAMNLNQWLVVAALSILPTVILEIEKLGAMVQRRRVRSRGK
ncbi:MAG: calcium-translocating P-type ATPase, PMCA-type [Oscillospiraceae bacterium]|jgi:Ca2+-transporting ATPase|nr:calcium-translocating P-type ATPase, PMCA-type [Oscillospiraceae bacterium]